MSPKNIFQHPQAIVESRKIGKGTRIWAFAHILPGAVIGRDCNICDGVFVENSVVVGDRVTVKCGVQLWDGVTLENDVFVGPNATFSNDLAPRSKQYPREFLKTLVREGASIGANATLLPGIIIGKHAMIGAGSVVTHDVPAYARVMGNPARIAGYENTASSRRVTGSRRTFTERIRKSVVKGVTLHRLNSAVDLRGSLAAGEFTRDIPFAPKRYFVVYDVPSSKVRGEHAHRTCKQFLICVKGSVSVVVDDGARREEFTLDHPEFGLYLPPMVYGIQYRYSGDAVLLVFASEHYDPKDYIRDYDTFLKLGRK
jgi:UDP-2-acetamido-3-amino-2,3-dideoxy-glucuronate N-acetyltransferase